MDTHARSLTLLCLRSQHYDLDHPLYELHSTRSVVLLSTTLTDLDTVTIAIEGTNIHESALVTSAQTYD